MTKTAGSADGPGRCAGDAGAGLVAADADATGTAMAVTASAAAKTGARRLSAFNEVPFLGDRPDWDAAAAPVQSLGGAKRYTRLFAGEMGGLIGLAGAAHTSDRAGAAAAVGRQPYDHAVGRHVVPDDGARALGRLDLGPGARRVLLELLVERVLVLQAAHQPPARPGDAHRVHRQGLVFGHSDRARLEVLEERRAAQIAAARADPALQPGLVARADLLQLDPGPHPRGQVADERAEVDPVRRAEVQGEDVGGGHVVDRDDLHRQVVLADQPPRGHPPLGPAASALLVPVQVLLDRQAGADRQAIDVLRHPLGGPDALGHLGAAVGGHEHLVADLRLVAARVEVVKPPVPLETDRHDHAHRASLRRDGPDVSRPYAN